MSETIETHGNRERQLSADWKPWTWQILTFSDGEHYGREKGSKIVTSQSNSETEELARKAWSK